MKNSKEILLNANNIVVVRTDRLGDMVLTLPMFKVLKQFNPTAKLHIICRTYVRALVENIPEIDKVHYLDENYSDIQVVFRKNKFDVAFFPRARFDEFYASFKSGVRLRVGSAYRIYSFLMNQRVRDHRKNGEYHEAEYNVRLISDITNEEYTPQLIKPYVSPNHKTRMEALLDKFDVRSPIVVLHPGSGGSSKNWSAVRFAELANLLKNNDISMIITGIKSESELCEIVHNSYPQALNLCGLLSLEETVAMLSHANLLVANSTGIIHIAAALGLKTIGLYPNTKSLSAKRWGPYSELSKTLSPEIISDTDQDDLNNISSKEVFDSIIQLLQKN